MRLLSCRTIGSLVVGTIIALWLCLPLRHNSNDSVFLTNYQLAWQLYRSAMNNAEALPDTAEAGMEAARTDLQRGIRKYMAYGLILSMDDFRDLQAHGFEILHGGCLLGGDGYQFWMGYNEVMLAEAERLDVDRSMQL